MERHDHLVSNDDHHTVETFICTGEELRNNVRKWIRQANLIQLSIYKGEHLLLSVPITVSAVVLRLYPFLSLLSTAYLLKHHFTIKIQKPIL